MTNKELLDYVKTLTITPKEREIKEPLTMEQYNKGIDTLVTALNQTFKQLEPTQEGTTNNDNKQQL